MIRLKRNEEGGKRGPAVIVSVTNQGYMKRLSLDKYRAQRRGGKGVKGLRTRKGDFLARIFVASTKDLMLFFTDRGRVHWLEVGRIPAKGRSKPITKLLELKKLEEITSAMRISEFRKDYYLTMVTKEGMIKKTNLSEYSHPRRGGIIAIKLGEYDDLVRVLLTTGKDEILVSTSDGYAIKFSEEEVSPTGRGTMGVRAIRLKKGSSVIGATVVAKGATLLTATENGYGKRTSFDKYPLQRRGGLGVKDIKTNERNGLVVAARAVRGDDEVMFTTSTGRVLRMAAGEIPEMGRNVQGVRIMKLEGSGKLVSATLIVSEKEQAEVEKGWTRKPLKSIREALREEVEKEEAGDRLLKKAREAVKEELGVEGQIPEEAKEKTKEGTGVKEEVGREETAKAVQKSPEEGEIPEEEIIGTGREVLTEIDRLLEILDHREKISIGNAAKELGVDKKLLEGWVKMLEDAGLVKSQYSIIGGTIITKGPKFDAVEDELRETEDTGPIYYNFR